MASISLERKRAKIQTPRSSLMRHTRAGVTTNKGNGRKTKRSAIRRKHSQ